MAIFPSRVQQVPRVVAGAAEDAQHVAFVLVFQLAARFDGPATTLFDVAERVDAGARTLIGLGRKVLPTTDREVCPP